MATMIPKDRQRKLARQFLSEFSTRDDWLVCDTETTGPDPESDEMCSRVDPMWADRQGKQTEP